MDRRKQVLVVEWSNSQISSISTLDHIKITHGGTLVRTMTFVPADDFRVTCESSESALQRFSDDDQWLRFVHVAGRKQNNKLK